MLPKSVKLFFSGSTQMFLAPGIDGCLELHNDFSLQKLATEAEHSAAGNRRKKAFSRLFFAQSEACATDAQGRIRVPQRLADLASLETKVCIVGVGSHWEIWNQQSWNLFLNENSDGFDQIAESTFDPETQIDQNSQRLDSEEIEQNTETMSKPR